MTGLEHLRDLPGGAGWLDALPRLVAECAEQWGLDLGRPMPGGNCAVVAPAGDVVLKVGFPHEESAHEALALRAWDGGGAVRLVAEDPDRHAMLLERCRPGTPLFDLGEEAVLDVAVALAPRLWMEPPAGLRLLSEITARWVEELPASWERHGRPFESRLLDAAVDALRELGPTQGDLVLANEDFHAGNVLRAEREPWLLIDPKPVAAERAFTVVAMVRDRKREVLAGPDPLGRVRRRLDRFSSELGLDRERVRGWALAHTLAWGFEPSGFHESHVGMARLLLET